jgi:RNA polymerase sigma-70 factor, ECF subfamily
MISKSSRLGVGSLIRDRPCEGLKTVSGGLRRFFAVTLSGSNSHLCCKWLKAEPGYTAPQYASLFQQGDKLALSYFYKEFLPALTLYANKWVDDFSAAEEVASGAFLKAWKMHEKLDSYNAIRAYLYKIVYRDAMHYLRKEKSRSRVEEAVAIPDISFHSPYDHVIRTETYRLIHSALKELSPGSQQIISMYYLEGKTTGEIARELKLHPSSVKTQKLRGLDALRKRLLRPVFFIGYFTINFFFPFL